MEKIYVSIIFPSKKIQKFTKRNIDLSGTTIIEEKKYIFKMIPFDLFYEYINHQPIDYKNELLLKYLKKSNYIIHKIAADNLSIIKELEKEKKLFINSPIVIPKLDNLEIVQSREKIYRFLSEVFKNFDPISNNIMHKIKVPKYVVVNEKNYSNIEKNLEDLKLKFPLICKTIKACGSYDSHFFALLFSKKNLIEFHKGFFGKNIMGLKSGKLFGGNDREYILQKYHKHKEKLIKIYSIGKKVFLRRTRSIPDLDEKKSNSIILFHNQRKQLVFKFGRENIKGEVHKNKYIKLCKVIAEKINKKIGLYMFGVDVIIKDKTAFIIDINYFPDYTNIEDLKKYIAKVLHNRNKN